MRMAIKRRLDLARELSPADVPNGAEDSAGTTSATPTASPSKIGVLGLDVFRRRDKIAFWNLLAEVARARRNMAAQLTMWRTK